MGKYYSVMKERYYFHLVDLHLEVKKTLDLLAEYQVIISEKGEQDIRAKAYKSTYYKQRNIIQNMYTQIDSMTDLLFQDYEAQIIESELKLGHFFSLPKVIELKVLEKDYKSFTKKINEVLKSLDIEQF